MYSQYQRYQPTNNASTTVSAQWTGSQWVTPSSSSSSPMPTSATSTPNNSAVVQSSTYSSYNNNDRISQNTKPTTATAAATTTVPNAELSQMYTKYYHQWNNKSQEQNRLARTLPPNTSQRDEAERASQWADYYAQQSSAAAHFYAGSAHGGTSPPPLPPPPPADNAASSINNCVQQQQQQQQQQPQHQYQVQRPQPQQQLQQQQPVNNNTKKFPSRWDRGPPASISETQTPAAPAWQRPTQQPQQTQIQPQLQQQPQAPDGMKNYVHRCLSRCNTDSQRTTVQKQIEQLISNAIQTGTMHTMNWDTVDLIPVPGERQGLNLGEGGVGGRHLQQQQQQQQQHLQNYQHHPPPPVRDPRPMKKARTTHISSSNNNNDTNYYGPSTSSTDESPSRKSAPNFQGSNKNNHQQISQVGYYGPSSSCGNSVNSQDSNNYYGNHGNKQQSQQQRKHQQHKKKNKTSSSDEKKYGYYGDVNRNDSFGETEDDFISLPGNSNKGTKNQQQSNKKKQNKNNKKQQQYKLDGFNRTTEKMAKRADRFSGKGGIASAAGAPTAASGKNVERYMGRAVIGGSQRRLDETDYVQMTVKGTCSTLEKEYLRLTAPPRAELVRPKHILEQHLQNLKLERARNKNTESSPHQKKNRDYAWFCSQFKALRQDLTVQRINDVVTVDTYETHARVALEEGDLNEYNQCQTQLKELYRMLSSPPSDTSSSRKEALKNQNEFIAYRIIYYVFLTGNKKYDGGSSDLLKIMLSLTNDQREDPCIQHALKVRVAVAEFDYHAFFRLQDSCPNLGAFLMDIMVPQVRFGALQRVCKAFRPSIPVKFILNELGFDADDSSQLKEGQEWLISHGCVLSTDEETLLTKDSAVTESNLTKKSSLI